METQKKISTRACLPTQNITGKINTKTIKETHVILNFITTKDIELILSGTNGVASFTYCQDQI